MTLSHDCWMRSNTVKHVFFEWKSSILGRWMIGRSTFPYHAGTIFRRVAWILPVRSPQFAIPLCSRSPSPQVWDSAGPYAFLNLINVPFWYSSKAILSSSCVFMTIGPYQATGSPIGFPETRRKRTLSFSAVTTTSSPSS